MKTKINTATKKLREMNLKVVEVTKDHYTLENGDIYEHTFEIDDNITVEEFQKLLDNAQSLVVDTLNKIDNDEL
jgi:hypothetical protein